MTNHDSDCAVYNEPALAAGPCDCSVSDSLASIRRQLYREYLDARYMAANILDYAAWRAAGEPQ